MVQLLMNKKLYVGNLPLSAEVEQLQALFGQGGRQVVSVHILADKKTGRSRGYAFVDMATVEDAMKAMDALHGRDFMGRTMSVNEAREPAHHEQGTGAPNVEGLAERITRGRARRGDS